MDVFLYTRTQNGGRLKAVSKGYRFNTRVMVDLERPGKNIAVAQRTYQHVASVNGLKPI